MITKIKKAFELRYPMIQFLIDFYYFILIALAKQSHEKIDVLARTQ